MAAPTTKTLFNPAASPQTGVGDANSAAFKVWSTGSEKPGPVTIQATGTWAGVTLKFQVCVDDSVSPLVWANAQVVDPSAGTLADASMTANGTIVLDVTEGVLIRGVISGSGSPLPSLTVKAKGHLNTA